MIITYAVKKNDNSLYCGNCKMRLPRLTYSCPFCAGTFSNYQIVLRELFQDYEDGRLTFDEICNLIVYEGSKESEE